CSKNHSAPSGPVVIPKGPLLGLGIGNSVITPAVVIRPILLVSFSVNHSAPSGPVVISQVPRPVGIGNSVITPAVVIRPILLAPFSVNHSAPSGPVVIPRGPLWAVGVVNSVKVCADACLARPTAAPNRTISTTNEFRYRYPMRSPQVSLGKVS